MCSSRNVTPLEVANLIKDNQSNISFIFGNGINRSYPPVNQNGTQSWAELLKNLWTQFVGTPMSSIPDGISFTEFYDIISVKNSIINNLESLIQEEIKKDMSSWTGDSSQNAVWSKILQLNAPLLTTNFDNLIPSLLSQFLNDYSILTLKEKPSPIFEFSSSFPWNCYYSNNEINSPVDGFGIWYINGMIKYPKSIKLGLFQYMANVNQAKELLYHKEYGLYNKTPGNTTWLGSNTWLDIFFNKSIFIFGLGLDESEVFLRWLLLERAKYYKLFPNRKKNTWYVQKQSNTPGGKELFLNSIGCDILNVDEYSYLYNEIWETI